MGRTPRDLLDPASMNPEQLTPTPTKWDLLNEEIQKLAMRTHLEAQQREDTCGDLAEWMKFVPPDLRARESVFYWQEDPSKIQHEGKSSKWLKVAIIAIKGPVAVFYYNTGLLLIFQTITSKFRRPLDTVDLEELPGQTRVSELEHLFYGSLEKDKQMSGKCSQTIRIRAPFSIDKDIWLQNQQT